MTKAEQEEVLSLVYELISLSQEEQDIIIRAIRYYDENMACMVKDAIKHAWPEQVVFSAKGAFIEDHVIIHRIEVDRHTGMQYGYCYIKGNWKNVRFGYCQNWFIV